MGFLMLKKLPVLKEDWPQGRWFPKEQSATHRGRRILLSHMDRLQDYTGDYMETDTLPCSETTPHNKGGGGDRIKNRRDRKPCKEQSTYCRSRWLKRAGFHQPSLDLLCGGRSMPWPQVAYLLTVSSEDPKRWCSTKAKQDRCSLHTRTSSERNVRKGGATRSDIMPQSTLGGG